MNDVDRVRRLIPLWYATRRWAEEVLVRAFGFESADEVLEWPNRGRHSIPGTDWMCRTHGVGVDVYRTEDVGGIDFDFDKEHPDEWRLRLFIEKQYGEGNLAYDEYRELVEDEDRLIAAVRAALDPDHT